MNYKLINFTIEKSNGNSVANAAGKYEASEYLKCAAMNPFDPQEPTHNVVNFDQNIVKLYKSMLPQSRGGELPDDESWTEGNLKPIYRVLLNAMSMEYDLGGDYCRTYTTPIINAEGETVHDAGDVVCNADKTPKVFSKILIFVRYAFETEPVLDASGMPKFDAEGNPMQKVMRDEHGQPIKSWVKGWSPSEVGESMRRLLISKEAAYAKLGTVVDVPKPTAEDIFDTPDKDADANTDNADNA